MWAEYRRGLCRRTLQSCQVQIHAVIKHPNKAADAREQLRFDEGGLYGKVDGGCSGCEGEGGAADRCGGEGDGGGQDEGGLQWESFYE